MTHSKRNQAIIEADARGYFSTSDGKIWNPDTIYSPEAEPLKGSYKNGYHHFYIHIDGKPQEVPSHRFIMYQLKRDRALSTDVEVRHLDGCSQNNAWHNLELGSRSENEMDKPKDVRTNVARHAALVRHHGDVAA